MIAAVLAAALIAGPPPTAEHPIVVGETQVSRGFLRHRADLVRGPRADARAVAVAVVIGARWVRGEAAERGIVVTRRQVTRAIDRVRRNSRQTRREHRRFLRDVGLTMADLRFETKTELLSDRLRKQAAAGAATPEEQQAAVDAFVRAFRTKWRARTACRAPWISATDCGARSPARSR